MSMKIIEVHTRLISSRDKIESFKKEFETIFARDIYSKEGKGINDRRMDAYLNKARNAGMTEDEFFDFKDELHSKYASK